MQKMTLLHQVLRYNEFKSPVTIVVIQISDHAHSICKIDWKYDDIVSTCKKSGDFIILFKRYSSFKYPTI